MTRYSGLHFENGHPQLDRFVAYPGSFTVMGSPEAVWWFWELKDRRPDMTIVYRHIPAPGFRPAELGYSAHRFVDHMVDQIDRLSQNTGRPLPDGIIVQVGNELNLSYERGDNADDWQDLEERYRRLADFLFAVLVEFRNRLPHLIPAWPAWSPAQRVFEHAEHWLWAAREYPVHSIHCYGGVESGRKRRRRAATALIALVAGRAWVRENLPGKDWFIGEWHGWSRDDVENERDALGWLAGLADEDPHFLGAARFIAKWHRPSEGWTDEWDVFGNPEMEALFMAPPGVAAPEPPPPLPPIIDVPPEVPAVAEPIPTLIPNRDRIVNTCFARAGEDSDLLRALLGLAWAESTFVSYERWHIWTAEAEPALARGDRAKLQELLDRGRAKGTRDFSFGPFHESLWRMSAALDPWGLQAVLIFRATCLDVNGQTDRAARWIKPRLDEFGLSPHTLGLWNKEDGSASAGVIDRYRKGLEEAERIIAAHEPPPPPAPPPLQGAPMDQALADLWRAIVPDVPLHADLGIYKYWVEHRKRLGSPCGPERYGGDGTPHQAFSGGVIVRWDPSGPVEV